MRKYKEKWNKVRHISDFKCEYSTPFSKKFSMIERAKLRLDDKKFTAKFVEKWSAKNENSMKVAMIER